MRKDRVLRFGRFCEAISGTELIGSMGPNYGSPELGMPLDGNDVTMMHCSVDGELYTKDQYDELYKRYIAQGGEPLQGVSKANLDKIVHHLGENR
jgi:hypothetical protein